MAQKYIHFAPIGSTLTRKERMVNINERRYLAILDALNTALLKQKSIQMNSASLKLMNAPYYPLSPSALGETQITNNRSLSGNINIHNIFLLDLLRYWIIHYTISSKPNN